MSGLWDDIEEESAIEEENSIDINQDFTNKEYRTFLLETLIGYSINNNILIETVQNFSLNLKNISEKEKEELLEIFTENSELLKSTNSYLKNPIKGINLLSNIISSNKIKDKNDLEIYFDNFTSFLKNDFIKFSNQIKIENELEHYNSLLNIQNELSDKIKFPELVNKTIIGIGGSFSAGKSSFLNSILEQNIDEDILPIDSVPTTSIPTFIVKKNQTTLNNDLIDIFTFNKNGYKAKIDKEALLAISHEFNKVYKFGLTSIINKIVVELKNAPYENIAFLDTPGYSKADGKSNIDYNLAKNHLTNIDSMIWLIDVDNGIIRNEDIKFLKSLKFNGDILFIVNKSDKKPLNDIKDILNAIKETLEKSHIKYIDVIAYSSHDKKEYCSENQINNFLRSNNKAKLMNFEEKVKNIFNQYSQYIDILEDKNKKLLKLFNQIDLYGNNFVSSLENFDEILSNIKTDTNHNRRNRDLYNENLNKAIKLISAIDNDFNRNISIEDKFNAGKYKNVLDYCNQQINNNKANLKIYLFRAKCHYNLKKYNMAIFDYTEVIKLGEENLSLIYYERGYSYLQLNRYKEALSDYEKVLILDPQNNRIKTLINLLKKIT